MRRFLYFFLVLLSFPIASINAQVVLVDNLYRIRNVATGYILEIPATPNQDALAANGTRCTERSDAGTANQQWYTKSSPYYGGLYIYNRNSNKALTIDMTVNYNASSQNVFQNSLANSSTGAYSQDWSFEQVYDSNSNALYDSNGNSIFNIRNLRRDRYLAPQSNQQYAFLGIQDLGSSSDLITQWVLENIVSSYQSGSVKITNVNSGKVLQVIKQSADPGAGIEQGNYIGITSQQWQQIPYGSGYSIINRLSGLALQVVGQSNSAGALLEQGKFVGISSQIWIVNTDGISGNYTFRNSNSGLVMQVIGQSTTDGAQMEQGNRVPIASQSWTITPVSNARVLATATPNQSANQLFVYPNPSNDNIVISFANNNVIQNLSILDSRGVIVKKASIKSGGNLDISDLTSGVYIIASNDGQSINHGKFVKL